MQKRHGRNLPLALHLRSSLARMKWVKKREREREREGGGGFVRGFPASSQSLSLFLPAAKLHGSMDHTMSVRGRIGLVQHLSPWKMLLIEAWICYLWVMDPFSLSCRRRSKGPLPSRSDLSPLPSLSLHFLCMTLLLLPLWSAECRQCRRHRVPLGSLAWNCPLPSISQVASLPPSFNGENNYPRERFLPYVTSAKISDLLPPPIPLSLSQISWLCSFRLLFGTPCPPPASDVLYESPKTKKTDYFFQGTFFLLSTYLSLPSIRIF